MKRTFIAIDIVPGLRLTQMLTFLKAELSGESVKWVQVDNMHLTIAFLGDTDDQTVNKVSSMLSQKCDRLSEFEINIAGAGVFKSIYDPRVIWAGIEDTNELRVLYDTIKSGLDDLGIKTEERTFNPHLTLGRIKTMKNSALLKGLIEKYSGTTLQKVTVSELVFFESILQPAGPVYRPVIVAPFGSIG
jgi:2'-5' RNA ligase